MKLLNIPGDGARSGRGQLDGRLLPRHLDARHEAARLRILFDGLSIQLVTTPRRATVRWATAVVDEHFDALRRSVPPRR